MRVIEYINPPFLYTNKGERISIMDVSGIPRVGSELDNNNKVQNSAVDIECTNGSCPVK